MLQRAMFSAAEALLSRQAPSPGPRARAMARAPKPQVEPASSLGPLRMIFAAATRYPGKVALALAALVITAAATLAIPSGFRLIIDRGFAAGADPAEKPRSMIRRKPDG